MRELESRFGPELVVIGVHSGKFHAERKTANIREAVMRLGIEHPVVNDRQFRIWRDYAIDAWPTLVVIDPAGRVVAQQAGEVPAEALARVVEPRIAAAESQGTLVRTPLRWAAPDAAAEPEARAPLRYPAKVAVEASSNLLYVADSGHHRVLVVRLDADGRGGETVAAVGGGGPGFVDGGLADASLRDPHGLAPAGVVVYVADKGNHAIRAIDLDAGTVRTVAGTGTPGRTIGGGQSGRSVSLRSPWDVLYDGGALFVAMAGAHQIWRVDPRTGAAEPWAGTGAEALHDGARGHAAFAQPSGLASDGRRLFIADSESSSIRVVALDGSDPVRTLVGTGLFDFGDRDGTGDEVRLQHPLGVAWSGETLYVADTYNGKLKALDPRTRTVRSRPEHADGLWEPGGIAAAGDRLYIADTNRHRIVTTGVDGTGFEPLEIRGAGPTRV